MKAGIAILSVMAAIWAVGALLAARGSAPWLYPVVVIVALFPLAAMTRRRFSTGTREDGRRIGRLVGLASAFEGVAIIAGIFIVNAIGRPDLIVCAIAGVVGLHFLPLARWIPSPGYYVTGLALLVAAFAGAVLPGVNRAAFVAGAASAILWVTALTAVFRLPLSASQAD